MNIVSRPQKKVVIQFREFKRPKKGAMTLSTSQTLTLHDIDLATVYEVVKRALSEMSPSPAAHIPEKI
jgi:hypothetical protein